MTGRVILDWIKREPGTVAAFLLFAATVALVCVTRSLVNDTEKTAERQLRAYIQASPNSVFNLESGSKLEAYIIISNSGQTPGKEVERWAAMKISKPLTTSEVAELGWGDREEGKLVSMPHESHAIISSRPLQPRSKLQPSLRATSGSMFLDKSNISTFSMSPERLNFALYTMEKFKFGQRRTVARATMALRPDFAKSIIGPTSATLVYAPRRSGSGNPLARAWSGVSFQILRSSFSYAALPSYLRMPFRCPIVSCPRLPIPC
jgi:hypothetical protein